MPKVLRYRMRWAFDSASKPAVCERERERERQEKRARAKRKGMERKTKETRTKIEDQETRRAC